MVIYKVMYVNRGRKLHYVIANSKMGSPHFVSYVHLNAVDIFSEYIPFCLRDVLSAIPILPLYYWCQRIRHFFCCYYSLCHLSKPLTPDHPSSSFSAVLTTALTSLNKSDTPDIEPKQNMAVYKTPPGCRT